MTGKDRKQRVDDAIERELDLKKRQMVARAQALKALMESTAGIVPATSGLAMAEMIEQVEEKEKEN